MKHLLYFLFLLCPALVFTQHDAPILTLNTEMHTAVIRRIDTDASGKYILTCSDDKTAKLWSTETGKLLQTYRPPIDLGNEGMLFAAAISPDGRYVAMGGYPAFWSTNKTVDIYIFDTFSGIMTHRIRGLSNVINDLEFSPNGDYLVASLWGDNGVQVYHSNTWISVAEDSDYAGTVNNVAFAPDGSLATASYDGHIRLYNSSFGLIRKVKTTGGEQPFSLTFSPDGQLLAVGYEDSPKIQVMGAKSLQLLYEPDITGATKTNDRLNKVTFSKDGRQLIAGGNYRKYEADGKWWLSIRIWENKGRGSYEDYPAAESTILDIKVLPNGHIAYAGHEPGWGILNQYSGARMIYQEVALNDHNKTDRSHFKINANGGQISWKPLYADPFTFDIETRSLQTQIGDLSSYQANTTTLSVSDWENSYTPKLNGQPLSFLEEYEMCRSVDINNDGQSMIFGAEWHIYGLAADGNQLWETPAQAIVWAVNITGNGKVVAACMSDGLIRWYRMRDGALLLSLYVHPDRERWVLWTPSGYYDASAGAEDFIGWHVNQGQDTEALYYPASKFRSTYYRPDVIDRIFEANDETEALRLANLGAQRSTTSTRTVANELPPTVRILSPTMGAEMRSNTVTIEYNLRSPNNENVTGIKILVDGRPVANDRGLKPAGQRHSTTIQIPSGNCTVSVIAENRFGTSPAASVDLVWQGQLELSTKPNLYILAVGVADYEDDNYVLDFPDDDAAAFVATMQKQEGLVYNRVVPKLLIDSEATKDNILDGLDWLVSETTQRDVAMLFFAGHGVEDNNGTFFYLPVGANDAYMRRTCLMKTEIRETVATVAGKILVFMDACHSGNMMVASGRRGGNPNIDRIVNELITAENGAVVFSSSTGRQSSLEDVRWGHGAFTKALVEGLEGAAALDDGKITHKSLDIYITERVKQLTGGQQTPTTNVPPNVPDFPIGIAQ